MKLHRAKTEHNSNTLRAKGGCLFGTRMLQDTLPAKIERGLRLAKFTPFVKKI